MSEENVYAVLNEVAKRNGVSVESVIADIEQAIEETLRTIKQKNDLTTLRKWDSIPSAGEVPSAIELIMYLGDIMRRLS